MKAWLLARIERVVARVMSTPRAAEVGAGASASGPRRQLLHRLLRTPHWDQRLGMLREHFQVMPDQVPVREPVAVDSDAIHYGCGANIIPGWLNVDLFQSDALDYRQIDLLERHPFEDGQFAFAFCEDVLEHLTQAESIFFLSEVARTLRPGGVLRLSFPGLEGVLERHYQPPEGDQVIRGEVEAYTAWDHHHFYSRGELDLVACHLGFRDVVWVEYGRSSHQRLCGLDTRHTQIGLNTYVELTR